MNDRENNQNYKNSRERLQEHIAIAAGRKKADLVFANARIVDVFGHKIVQGNVAVHDGVVIGIGVYEGKKEIDVKDRFLAPGFIDSHVHIESSLISPEQFATAVIPRGTTAIIADPHEISNVCGITGIEYMLRATEKLPLSVYFMLPSCVPATPFENAGAVLDAPALATLIDHPRVLGLGEMMNYPGVIESSAEVIDKLMIAKEKGKLIDGHAPGIEGKELAAYVAAGIKTEHECSTLEEMRRRMRLGMYILIRQGSAARNLKALIRGVKPENSRRALFCTDDKQAEDILNEGHLDHHLRLSVRCGLDPITALQMATINAAECYRLHSSGAVAPGYRADLVILEDLKHFNVQEVYIRGKCVAKEGQVLYEDKGTDISSVSGLMNVADFSPDKLLLTLDSEIANVISIQPGNLVTEKVRRKINRDSNGVFQYHEQLDILKIAVIERHKGTGNVGLGLIENYQLKGGAIATTIAHDSHNIIVVGDDDDDMYLAVQELIKTGGGITLCSRGKVIDTLLLPIAGLMSDQSPQHVSLKLKEMNRSAFEKLDVNPRIDPFMTLSFMALPVIPELKITDMGLFDVGSFEFIPVSV